MKIDANWQHPVDRTQSNPLDNLDNKFALVELNETEVEMLSEGDRIYLKREDFSAHYPEMSRAQWRIVMIESEDQKYLAYCVLDMQSPAKPAYSS